MKRQEEMRIKYSVRPTRHTGSLALIEYQVKATEEGGIYGQLSQVSWSEGCDKGVIEATVREVPVRIHYRGQEVPPEMGMWVKVGCKVANVTDEVLDFVRFWNLYGYKVGDKARCAKKWERLPMEDRMLALAGIARQRRHSESKGTEMPYPETYLNQRRWENEF